MLSIAMGIGLRLSKAKSDDVPIALLAFCALLCDFILMLLVAGMLIDGSVPQDLVAIIIGGCR